MVPTFFFFSTSFSKFLPAYFRNECNFNPWKTGGNAPVGFYLGNEGGYAKKFTHVSGLNGMTVKKRARFRRVWIFAANNLPAVDAFWEFLTVCQSVLAAREKKRGSLSLVPIFKIIFTLTQSPCDLILQLARDTFGIFQRGRRDSNILEFRARAFFY